MKLTDLVSRCHVNKNSLARAIKISTGAFNNKIGSNHWDKFTPEQKDRVIKEVKSIEGACRDFLHDPEF